MKVQYKSTGTFKRSYKMKAVKIAIAKRVTSQELLSKPDKGSDWRSSWF